ncbi:MAG: polymerase subunit epsilon, partial [Thermoleophilaceae bacterium]|nr:polymerase subunit epsilon [Thermoleophilaceae bacterium]
VSLPWSSRCSSSLTALQSKLRPLRAALSEVSHIRARLHARFQHVRAARSNTRPMELATAEYVCVDTETNGRPGEDCELTEVGAVLVGGGELHERFESLVRVERPLSRGIERFTGITQAMVDEAPPAAEVLPGLKELVEGRVLVAHSASFDRRVLAQAFDRAGIEWQEPPILCTVAMARRFAPLARQRKLAPLAEALGIEVQGVHRALVDAETCAKVFCALFPKLCATAATLAEALALLHPRRGTRTKKEGRRVPREERPDLTKLPDDPGVYIFRDVRGRPLYVGKSVSLKSRARSHFCAPAGWTERAEVVDYKPTNSELGALVLENRLIKQWRPTGNKKLKRTDGYVYIRARLDIPFPILEVAPEPAAGLAINVGPVRGHDLARELVDQLNSLFALRHCGRALPRRDHPSAYGQMGRCLSPCLRDLDPNAYRRRLDEALAPFSGSGDGGEALIARIEAQMHEAAAAQRYERAAVLLRRRERLAALVGRLSGLLEATHARSRLVLARHPAKDRWDVFWIAAGMVADWGPLAGMDELAERTAAALATKPRSRRATSPEQVDEIRIVHTWIAAHDPPRLELGDEPPADSELSDWVRSVCPDSATGTETVTHNGGKSWESWTR